MASKPPVFNNDSEQAVPKFNHQSQAQVGLFFIGLLELVVFVQPCIQEKKSFKFIHLANEPLKPKFKLYNY